MDNPIFHCDKCDSDVVTVDGVDEHTCVPVSRAKRLAAIVERRWQQERLSEEEKDRRVERFATFVDKYSSAQTSEKRIQELRTALRWLLDSIPHHEGDDNLTEPIQLARKVLQEEDNADSY